MMTLNDMVHVLSGLGDYLSLPSVMCGFDSNQFDEADTEYFVLLELLASREVTQLTSR